MPLSDGAWKVRRKGGRWVQLAMVSWKKHLIGSGSGPVMRGLRASQLVERSSLRRVRQVEIQRWV